MGNFVQARTLYQKAQKLLSSQGQPDPRLEDGIRRRMSLMDDLERRNIRCAEPASPTTPAEVDAGTRTPYFPDIKALYEGLSPLGKAMEGCGEDALGAIDVRFVVAGTGEIIRAEVRGDRAGTNAATCLETKILAAAPQIAQTLPRFSACFRSYARPYVLTQ